MPLKFDFGYHNDFCFCMYMVIKNKSTDSISSVAKMDVR